MSNINIWFIIFLFLQALDLGIDLANDGKQKEGKVNFWSSLIAVSIETFIVIMAMRG